MATRRNAVCTYGCDCIHGLGCWGVHTPSELALFRQQRGLAVVCQSCEMPELVPLSGHPAECFSVVFGGAQHQKQEEQYYDAELPPRRRAHRRLRKRQRARYRKQKRQERQEAKRAAMKQLSKLADQEKQRRWQQQQQQIQQQTQQQQVEAEVRRLRQRLELKQADSKLQENFIQDLLTETGEMERTIGDFSRENYHLKKQQEDRQSSQFEPSDAEDNAILRTACFKLVDQLEQKDSEIEWLQLQLQVQQAGLSGADSEC